MTEAWQTKAIGEIFRVVNGGTPKTGIRAFWDGVHQWITPAEMGALESPYLASSRRTLTNAGLQAAELVPANSIILSSRAPIGHLVINEVPMAFNQGCKGLVPTDGIDTKFAYYYLMASMPLLESLGTGATFKELSGGKLKKVLIRFPAISEQQRIVGILDEAFTSIATARACVEKSLQNARELFVSEREMALTNLGRGWREAPLADLCGIKHGYAFEGEFFARAGEHVLLTPGNFFEAGGYRDRGEKQKYFVGSIPMDFVLSEGDLLVAMTEQAAGLLGSPLLVPESERFLHNQRLGRIVAHPGVPWCNEFFFHVFNLRCVRAEIHTSASGVKVRHTSPRKLGEIRVAFPADVAGQRAIAERLAEVAAECDALVIIQNRKIAALDELRQSLLHQAFSGQL